MKVYLAAQYSWRDRLKIHAKALEKLGFEITASWLHERKPLQVDLNDLSDRFNREHAQIDLDDIRRSDWVVSFTVDPTSTTKRGGRHVEFGLGYALGKRMVVCGPHENIFHYLEGVLQFDTFDDLLPFFRGLAK